MSYRLNKGKKKFFKSVFNGLHILIPTIHVWLREKMQKRSKRNGIAPNH